MSRKVEEQVADLSLAGKRALLAELLRQKSSKVHISPLSFAQQRLWFLAQLEPDNPSYNLRESLRLKGALNVNALEQTINSIIARHESLRTTFKAIDGQPVQVISGAHEIKLSFADLRELPEPEREAEARRLAMAEARRPFDLSRDYPLRATLLRSEDDDHWLVLTMHHIVSDGWSMGILTKELSDIYDAITTNQRIELPELPIQYADFAEWQREWFQGKVLEEQLDYWLNSLAGAPPELNLQTDHPRSAHQSIQGANLSLRLSQKLSRSLGELSRREGVTLFMTMLAAFQTLLFRYAGQEDIVVGTTIAGRNRVETENLIGFFVNTLALRTNFSGNPTFRQLLARVREVTLGAYAHQDLPFEKLVRELNPERAAGHSPIFQVMFAMQNAPSETLTLRGLTITRVPAPTGTAKFDLTLLVSETANGLTCRFEYNTDLFAENTIRRMLGHLESLLEGIVADSERPVLQLPLLKDEERTQLLTEWNDTQTNFPRERCVHEIFDRRVERTPNSVAILFEAQQLSYVELNRRANQLAHYLRKLGVGPDEMVGLCVERSAEMIVAVLGILKAGGAYLPLDATYPPERLSFMLKDSGARLLLTQEHLQDTLNDHGVDKVLLDRDWDVISRESEDNPHNLATAQNLAYVIYTSGSTGQPKGVGVTHLSVVRLVQESNYAHLGPDEVFLQFAPLSFDASTFEIWGSLLNGSRLAVMPPGVVSLRELGQVIKRHGVTTLWLTAGLFHQMVETELESLRGVRQLLAGGDVLSVPHVEQVARELSGCQLINGYGPTENTTFSCCYRVKSGERFAGSVPIGLPISNTQTYILDQQLEPVPIGVVGQLYLGGDGLARGYLNRPALTANAFVPDPFSRDGIARLYKTGDLARYLENGNIEYLGRADNQVKLRGFRIELGEIEAVLKKHPRVSEAIVLAREDVPGDRRLVAYLIPTRDGSESDLKPYSRTEQVTEGQGVANDTLQGKAAQSLTPELKKALITQLPEYMRPSEFIFLDEFPLTANGKIDRSALPPPGQSRPELEGPYVTPRTDIEKVLGGIWAEVLKRDAVGVEDNFFDLGGHSLLATQVISRIREHLKLEVPLRTMFESPTVASLATAVVELQQEAKPAPVSADRKGRRSAAKIEKRSPEEV